MRQYYPRTIGVYDTTLDPPELSKLAIQELCELARQNDSTADTRIICNHYQLVIQPFKQDKYLVDVFKESKSKQGKKTWTYKINNFREHIVLSRFNDKLEMQKFSYRPSYYLTEQEIHTLIKMLKLIAFF